MSLNVKHEGAYVEADGVYLKENGVYVRKPVYVKVDGVWVLQTRDLYFTPTLTRTYWGPSPSLQEWWSVGYSGYESYSDTWGDTSLWQGRRWLDYGSFEYDDLYTGSAFGCMQNFVECDGSGNVVSGGQTISAKLAGKVECIIATSMRLSRYNDGWGTQSVRIRRATIDTIPGQGSHNDTNYSDSGGGLPVEDSIAEEATKWCFSSAGNLPGMLNLIQWLMDGKVICIHYGMSETAHFYGTNGGATRRPVLKVTIY